MILVVGGAGYIGSHIVKELVKEQEVVVLDNLTTGHRWAVDEKAVFIKGDIGSLGDLDFIFSHYPIRAVMHFAANSLVGESFIHPMKYYENNVGATLTLLKKMQQYDIKQFIFSSTAAVYGIPHAEMLTEEHPVQPLHPYGWSKLMVEKVLEDYSRAYDFSYIILRYFNAAGADEGGELGESHDPETHLIPIVLQHLLGKREQISIFGDDYPTSDGTCIRDYIHVTDLASAHMAAFYGLHSNEKTSAVYNLGNGVGYSVKEVIRTCEKVTGEKATVIMAPRREGDPARLVASSQKIYKELGWKACYSLEDMIASAWKWHQQGKKYKL